MMYWYFDDSVQTRGEFVVGAFVRSSEDLAPPVANCLTSAGLAPGVDEFKSSAHMGNNPRQVIAREHLKCLFGATPGAEVGVVVVPLNRRAELGLEALEALRIFLDTQALQGLDHHVFFDEGNFVSRRAAEQRAFELGLSSIHLHAECDSRVVLGIQLADVAAHCVGIMLLASLGLFSKIVKAGDDSGYDPDSEMELEFELWATLRYGFMGCSRHVDPDAEDFTFLDIGKDTEPGGLYVSPHCSTELAEATRRRLGFVYLGCIH